MTREDMIEAMAQQMLATVLCDGDRFKDWLAIMIDDELSTAADLAQAALSALEAMGCVVVPREPTHEMIEAHNILVGEARLKQTLCPRAAYTAMIAAASPLPAQGRG